MDYGELLCRAHENNINASHKEVRCYKTSFSPPKKIERNKVSSVNVQKFLQRREEEEKKKREDARRKREELLALRSQDKKATRRVQTMLRATKSANKSVMEDAVDNVNTRDTLNGFKQCDEDDYGYVSQEAAALYNKLLNKYENMPPEPPKFEPAKKEVKDLKAAKDRVRAALQREAEEELLPHKRKKRKNSKDCEEPSSTQMEEDETKDLEDSDENHEKKEKKIKPKRPAPPPMNFDQLLQIAQKKQFEPIMIDESLLKKEPERLMTKKQKIEAERMASCKKNKASRPGEKPSNNVVEPVSKDEGKKKSNKGKLDQPSSKKTDSVNHSTKNDNLKVEKKQVPQFSKEKALHSKEQKEVLKKDTSSLTKSLPTTNRPNQQPPKISSNLSKSIKKVEKKPCTDLNSDMDVAKANSSKLSDLEKEIQKMKANQELLLRQLREKELAMKKMEVQKKKEVVVHKQVSFKKEPEKKVIKKPIPQKKKVVPPSVNKRRIDSESEEYDSELEDFIDDGPDDGNEYSKYISEIFGYDKTKYVDDDEDDDECMESNFAQISKEEYVSTKIGIMEDLEDIRKEQEEKKRLKEKKLRKLAEARKKKY